MKYVFGNPGLKELEAFCGDNTLLAFDFDGTLSKLTARPQYAQVSAGTEMLLHEISPLAFTAIISGRGIKDLKKLIPFKPNYLIGNHGLESPTTPTKVVSTAKKVTSHWTKQILGELELGRGVQLEDKAYSLSLHYRLASQRSLKRNQLVKLAEQLAPTPRIVLGKYVVNLIPPDSPDKGTALLDLMKHAKLDSAIYVGDDLTDEDVFSLSSPKVLGVRVGRIQKSSAPFYIKTQSEINRLLSHILFFLKNH
ncbi:MAG: trehalose-phosphatase [Pseudomonadota bacterium]